MRSPKAFRSLAPPLVLASTVFASIALAGCSRTALLDWTESDGGRTPVDAGSAVLDAGSAVLDAGAATPRTDGSVDGDGATGRVTATDIAVDPSGNIVVIGTLEGSVDLGGRTLTSAGGTDLWLASFNPAGLLNWTARFGDTLDQDGGRIITDSGGNIVLVSNLFSTLDLGGGLITLGAGDLEDIVVAKLDPKGKHIWSQRLGQPGVRTWSPQVALLPSDRIAVAHSSDLASTPGQATPLGMSLATLTTWGEPGWSVDWPAIADGPALGAVAVSPLGDVVITGSFAAAFTAPGGIALGSDGKRSIFVLELTESGGFTWIGGFGGRGTCETSALAIDRDGNYVLAGAFDYELSFGDRQLDTITPPDRFQPQRQVFVAKLARRGTALWSRQFGDAEEPQDATDVAIDSYGNVVVGGWYLGAPDLGLGPLPRPPAGHPAGFAVRLDGNGTPIWSHSFPNDSVVTRLSPSGNLLVAGGFPRDFAFAGSGDQPGSNPLRTFVGGTNVFMLEYGR